MEVMCFVPKRCNDMMNVGRLQGFQVSVSVFLFFGGSEGIPTHGNSFLPPQGKITAQGKLLQQDTFFVSEQDTAVPSRARERRVFLFEQLVIFSEPIDKKKGLPLPGYTFKNSIKVSLRPRPSPPPTRCPVVAASVLRSPPPTALGQLFGSGGAL